MKSSASEADEMFDAIIAKALDRDDYPVDEEAWAKLSLRLDIHRTTLYNQLFSDN